MQCVFCYRRTKLINIILKTFVFEGISDTSFVADRSENY